MTTSSADSGFRIHILSPDNPLGNCPLSLNHQSLIISQDLTKCSPISEIKKIQEEVIEANDILLAGGTVQNENLQ